MTSQVLKGAWFHRTCFGGNGRRSLKSAGSRIVKISNKRERIVHAWRERPSIDFFPHTRSPSPSALRPASFFFFALGISRVLASQRTRKQFWNAPSHWLLSKKDILSLWKVKNQSTQTGTSIAMWRLQWSWMSLAMASVQKLARTEIYLLINTGVWCKKKKI